MTKNRTKRARLIQTSIVPRTRPPVIFQCLRHVVFDRSRGDIHFALVSRYDNLFDLDNKNSVESLFEIQYMVLLFRWLQSLHME